jgi:hypothetical protein
MGGFMIAYHLRPNFRGTLKFVWLNPGKARPELVNANKSAGERPPRQLNQWLVTNMQRLFNYCSRLSLPHFMIMRLVTFTSGRTTATGGFLLEQEIFQAENGRVQEDSLRLGFLQGQSLL